MIKKIVFSFMLIVAIMISIHLSAQDRIIHGTVTTFDSIPLNGATVMVQSTKQKVLTDSLGNFSVRIANTDKLKVTAQGFYNQNVKLTDKIRFAAINLKLKPGEKSRELAIGYGYVTDADKLNAVAGLNKDDFDFSQYSNIYELIKGRFAGVQVAGGEIIIRGMNSINSSSAALIVVDGVPTTGSALSAIPPAQVKSINIIKDGTSAIYGSRGANGVVLIETKKGGDK